MNNDEHDRIRVDLLKFRRKAFLSYPEGSLERKTFLKTILQNELRITANEMPQDVLNLAVEGDKFFLRGALTKCAPWIGFAICMDIAFGFALRYSMFSFVFLIIGAIALVAGLEYIVEYFNYRKSVKTIEKYSNDIRKNMDRISGDIRRLDGPR